MNDETTQATLDVGRRYRLPELFVAGKPASDNRQKDKILVRSRAGRVFPIAVYTQEAQTWMADVQHAAMLAIAQRTSGTPHPREWPRPLRLTLVLHDGRLDLPNVLKSTFDALKTILDVDDRYYEIGSFTRAPAIRGRRAQRGLSIVVESAPVSVSAVTAADATTPDSRVSRSASRAHQKMSAVAVESPQRTRHASRDAQRSTERSVSVPTRTLKTAHE